MNPILIGLNTLAALLGYNRYSYYDFGQQDLIHIARSTPYEVIYNNGDYQLSNQTAVYDLYTLEGENRYVCFEFSNAYLIYDKKEDTIDEFSYTQSPYSKYDDLFYLYVEDSNFIKYGFVDEHSIYNIQYHCYLDDILSTRSIDRDSEAGQYLSFETYGSNVKKISNAYYFERLGDTHGTNADGTCGIVAIQILLGYYDTFENDHIIPEKFDVETRENKTRVSEFGFSAGSGEEFHNELIRFASSEDITQTGIGMDATQEKNLTVQYLQSRNINFSYKWVEGNWSDTTTNKCSKHLKEAIDAGRPVFVGAAGHASVAYAYDDNYVYVHSGWGDVRRTPWSTFDTGFFDFWGGPHTVDITGFLTPHYHSDNYFDSYNKRYLCPCGMDYDSLSLKPIDYGFEESYNINEYKDIVKDNYTFTTNRLRTGYIENEKINLSPRKEGAGTAYLEYHFNAYIKKIVVDLSLWSAKERLFSSDSTLKIEYYDATNNVWITALDLLSVNLGTDRYNQETYIIEFPYTTTSFRFYSTSAAVGDRNKGRLSIGNMEILCHAF